ncbi:PREDICTED: diacylglycerol kinase A-like, partial [Rhagoletis zephyria]|uniref:diacylglycerol kinase A-like n=1 Tax=Rhagoletis zephyria TaxID=28612 RepID=UPI0008116F37
MADVGFTLNDLFEFFALKGGKVVYSEIVTNFKSALSNPETLAEARNQFKDHVNTLATVTNENGTKYLVLRPKFMKKLATLADESFHNNHASSRTTNMIPIVPNSSANAVSNVPQKQPPPPPSQPSQPVLPPQAQYPQYSLPQAHSQPQYHHHHHSNGSNGANHFEASAAAAQM